MGNLYSPDRRDEETIPSSTAEQEGAAIPTDVPRSHDVTPDPQSDLLDWQLVPTAMGTREDSKKSNDILGLYSVRKPRDVTAGLASGVKSIAKGAVGGIVTLVAYPVMGAVESGFTGFLKNSALGLLGAVTLPVVGVGVGGYQVVRGFINTPQAIYEFHKGRKWDNRNREWIDGTYYLDAEASIVDAQNPYIPKKEDAFNALASEGTASNAATSSSSRPRKVKETAYYDLLQVSPDASKDVIRRQYYKLALQCHPDKNPDDPEAKQKFQDIGTAYQVLSDDTLREKYDKLGKSGTRDAELVDVSLFFTMLFGSEALQPFTGKLSMVLLIELMSNDSDLAMHTDVREFEERRREVKMALYLKDLMEPAIEADSDALAAWKEGITGMADELCKSSYGDFMVDTVGWVYENYAYQFLGKLDTLFNIGGRYAKLKAKSRNVGRNWNTAVNVVKSASVAYKLSRELKQKAGKESSADTTLEENTAGGESANKASAANRKGKGSSKPSAPSGTAEDDAVVMTPKAAQQMEAALPLLLQTFLDVCLLDIDRAVKNACKKLLKDEGIEINIRRKRAELLIEIGKIFQAAAARVSQNGSQSTQGGSTSARTKIEEAFIRTMERTDEKNNPEHYNKA